MPLTNLAQRETSIIPADLRLLEVFTPATSDEIRKIITKGPAKSCMLDPAPTWLLQKCSEELLPIITSMVNSSLANAIVPADLKCAHIRPVLKKPSLDAQALQNYRPVSNLSFFSKVLEKIVALRLGQHLAINNLHEKFQSAYKNCHSTETALIKVQSDILKAVDNGSSAVLILLDLSAAFDTIDHHLLLQRLESTFGIIGAALCWMRS